VKKLVKSAHDLFKEFIESVDIEAVGGKMKEFLQAFYYDCSVRNLAQKTIDSYRESLERFIKFLGSHNRPIEEIDKNDIRAFIVEMKGKNSDYTINDRLRVLKLFWNFLCKEGLWNGNPNPLEGIKLIKCEKKYPQVLDLETMDRLLALPNKRTFVGYRNYLILLLFWDCLMRLNELLTLKVSDIDLKAGMIRVMGKGRKERFIPLGLKSMKAIHCYLIKYRNNLPGEYLICKKDGFPFKRRGIQQLFHRMGQKIGTHLHPHLLRHSGSTQWLKSGGPPGILQKILGHTTQTTTQLYIHLAGVDTKDWHNRYSPGDRLKN
jgi:site-specific recombinase XerD